MNAEANEYKGDPRFAAIAVLIVVLWAWLSRGPYV